MKSKIYKLISVALATGLFLAGCSSDSKTTIPIPGPGPGGVGPVDGPMEDPINGPIDGPNEGPVEGPIEGPIDNQPLSVNSFRFVFDPDYIAARSEATLASDLAGVGRAIEPLNGIPNFLNNVEVPVIYGECGFANAFYAPSERTIVLCDELWSEAFNYFSSLDPESLPAESVAQAYSMMTFVLYHEIGHAIDDISNVSIGGNSESAADAIGTVLSVQTGQPVAAINAAVFFLQNDNGSFADVHGSGLDRAGDIICWTVGGSPQVAAQLNTVTESLAAAGRDCVGEYADQFQFVANLVPNLADVRPITATRSAETAGYNYAVIDQIFGEAFSR